MASDYSVLLKQLVQGTGSGPLFVAKQFKWVEKFIPTLDYRLRKSLTDKEAKNPPPYNAYTVEDQFRALTPLLDRCLSYRRDYEDLEVQAIKHALDYSLFLSQIKQQRQIENAPWIAAQRQKENASQETAAKHFSIGKEPLEQGFTAWADGSAKSATEALNGEKQRTLLASQKWDAMEEYQNELEKRHSAPGNALNFDDRAERILSFIVDDFKEAYLRARALEAGLSNVFGINTTTKLPSPKTIKLLDALVHWVRLQVDAFNLDQESYTEVEITVPLRRTWNEDNNEIVANWPGLVSDADYVRHLDNAQGNSGKGDGVLEFAFIPEAGGMASPIPPLLTVCEKVHLRGIGASLQSEYGNNDAKNRLNRGSVVIIPPPQPSFFGEKPRQVSPMVLTNVALNDPFVPVRMSSVGDFINIDLKGKWAVNISGLFGWPCNNGGPARRGSQWVQNINLHLLLSARLARDVGAWKGLRNW